MPSRTADFSAGYVETPFGLLGPGGTTFRTTVSLVEAYAGSLLPRVPLGRLIADAEAWLDAPRTVAIWAVVGLFFVGPPLVVAASVLVGYVVLTLLLPAVVVPSAVRGVALLRQPLLQSVAVIAALSILGMNGQTAAAATGLVLFALLRTGLLARLVAPLVEPVLARWYPLPVADQVLRGLMLRQALRFGISLPGLDALERDARSFWRKKR